jgi:hypothetical protein
MELQTAVWLPIVTSPIDSVLTAIIWAGTRYGGIMSKLLNRVELVLSL